jgi:curli biogenesis system outer membrane secretion channel CsgG
MYKKNNGKTACCASHVILNVFLALMVLILLAGPANAKGSKATIAVLPFKAISKIIATGPGFSSITWDEEQTNLLTADFVTTLVNSRKFNVVEREEVASLIKEKEFIDSGHAVDMGRGGVVGLGVSLGADYLILGQIEHIDLKAASRSIPYTTMVTSVVSGTMIVNMRIIDVRGGTIVAATKIETRRSEKGEQSLPILLERLKEKTVLNLVDEVIEGVFPVKIAQVVGQQVILNRGKGSVRFKEGAILSVYSTEGGEIFDEDTGESLGMVEVEVGKVRITEMRPKFTKAEIIGEPDSVLKKGYVCRVRKGEGQKQAPTQASEVTKRINW